MELEFFGRASSRGKNLARDREIYPADAPCGGVRGSRPGAGAEGVKRYDTARRREKSREEQGKMKQNAAICFPVHQAWVQCVSREPSSSAENAEARDNNLREFEELRGS